VVGCKLQYHANEDCKTRASLAGLTSFNFYCSCGWGFKRMSLGQVCERDRQTLDLVDTAGGRRVDTSTGQTQAAK